MEYWTNFFMDVRTSSQKLGGGAQWGEAGIWITEFKLDGLYIFQLENISKKRNPL